MKLIAALLLSSLLAVMAYGIFWLVSLTYTTNQMKDTVREALGADMAYGTPQWVPDPANVTMLLPNVSIKIPDGPMRELRAAELTLISSFFMRDRWTMKLPQRVEMQLANGKTVLLETENGEAMWLRTGGQLSLRATKVRLRDLTGQDIVEVGDVVLERRATDNNVGINLASRPKVGNGEGIVTGEMFMPARAFAAVVDLLGTGAMPTMEDIFLTISRELRKGGSLKLDNVSFKMPNGVGGAILGQIDVLPDGRAIGNIVVTADTAQRLAGWIAESDTLKPRNSGEQLGVARLANSYGKSRGTVRIQNMQDTLMMNGNPVGPLPVLTDVIARVW